MLYCVDNKNGIKITILSTDVSYVDTNSFLTSLTLGLLQMVQHIGSINIYIYIFDKLAGRGPIYYKIVNVNAFFFIFNNKNHRLLKIKFNKRRYNIMGICVSAVFVIHGRTTYLHFCVGT